MSRYVRALAQQIKEWRGPLRDRAVDTVYFGGGTPSLLGAKQLVSLLDALKDHLNILLDAEITLELNPSTMTREDLRILRREGVNRLSIGAQSADDGLLESLGRTHTFADTIQTVDNARETGFDNISLDLIYGLPSQSGAEWATTLSKMIALKPEHLSCYGLRIEEGTPLYFYKDMPEIPSEDAQADMYLYTVSALHEVGLRQYEISNFARPSCISRHNTKYWNLSDYIGLGPSAHSFMGGKRYSYVRDLSAYLHAMDTNAPLIDSEEVIAPSDKAVDYLMLGLRTTHGISGAEYFQIYPADFTVIETLLIQWEQQGWTRRLDGRWSFTPTGFLISNRLIREILDAHTEQRLTVGMPWKREEPLSSLVQMEL